MTTRVHPRAMLALIALAGLPTPRAIRFVDGYILALDLDGIADGQAWSRHLGGSTDTYRNGDTVYLREGAIRWRGWSVSLFAHEPVTPEGVPADLDSDTAARLALVARDGASVETDPVRDPLLDLLDARETDR